MKLLHGHTHTGRRLQALNALEAELGFYITIYTLGKLLGVNVRYCASEGVLGLRFAICGGQWDRHCIQDTFYSGIKS